MKTITSKPICKINSAGGVTTPAGYRAGGVHCGIRRKKLDLGWLISDTPATAAAVYTTNQFQAPPLKVTKESIFTAHKIQGVLVNSGVANACTGEKGLQDAYEMRSQFAQTAGIAPEHAAVASTGVIGVPLPVEKISQGLTAFYDEENEGTNRFEKAILTTDTCEKTASVELVIDGKTVTIGGAAKGSGMIDPNMATMLAFLTTDAEVAWESLQNALKEAIDRTFNMITVDGDSSTNDMVLLMANGHAGNHTLHEGHPQWAEFCEALQTLCESLAKSIAKDGEGATKLIEVSVTGAESDAGAKRIGKAIISSNLVKTAVFGSDPNWGRIVCAIGYSNEPVIPEKVDVFLGPVPVVAQGLPLPFDEGAAKEYLNNDTISIHAHLGQGEGEAKAWGCDLTYDYVKINASYRT
ncbi:bifunctional glutamate N-acetyltransferase/amino-acid acetyltransferase ArgJ [Alteribacter keqinensis]|uniref:Arginine biosynthesis bifunctional protein ArgJ n=1 Tax=Alteribacter keqinensis TaxID=2483800 RepID=A0A3M7TYM9_9BACI|nr:bifunctional glutamate N-acetyltransferase/amino-acid acetyltransferase ArgJ [Alteribacter keqinensis]RNA69904.1 bifunctional glutamate N-acetyltransferase/amino-acid acetyltransferase ArgJ [Alteribacter keqinensis]